MKKSIAALAMIVISTAAFAKEDHAGVLAWFARYDDLTKKGDVVAMADMAAFPVHVITNDGKGEGFAESWTREKFTAVMNAAVQGTPKDLKMTAKRQLFFLGDDLVVVVSDATYTTGKRTDKTRYADVLMKQNGIWKFQTMAQAGWGDMLKAPATPPK